MSSQVEEEDDVGNVVSLFLSLSLSPFRSVISSRGVCYLQIMLNPSEEEELCGRNSAMIIRVRSEDSTCNENE